MRAAVTTLSWLWRRARVAAPAASLWVVALTLLQAAVPALEVLAISAYIRTLATAQQFSDTTAPFIAVVALLVVSGPLRDIEQRIRFRVIDLIGGHLERELALTVAGLTPQELASPDMAERIENANNANQRLKYLFGPAVELPRDILAVIAVIATIASLSWLAALLILASLVPVLLISHRIMRIDNAHYEKVGPLHWRARYLHQHLVSAATSRELNALGAAREIGELSARVSRHITDARAATYPPILRLRLVAGIASALLLAAALAALAVGVQFGPIAAGAVYGVIAAMGAVAALGSNASELTEAMSPLTRWLRLQEYRRPPVTHTPKPPVNQLTMESVTFTYPGAQRPALADFTLNARAGQIIALVGVNGAGKTTAVACLLGALSPDRGTVALDGLTQRADDASAAAQWGSHFGALNQEFGRYEVTVRESLLLGCPRQEVTDDELWHALRRAHADDLVRRFEHGLDQQLGSQWPGGVGVSGGQWQRLSLARIFVRGAPVLVLDEPTSAIDAEAEQEIFQALQAERGDRITIVVSHRAWTLKGMDEIIVLDEGRVVQRGSYAELAAAPGRFAEIFKEQVGQG